MRENADENNSEYGHFLRSDGCKNIHLICSIYVVVTFKVRHCQSDKLSCYFFCNFILGEAAVIFFFYQGFLSQTLAIYRAAEKVRELSFISLYHFRPITNIQTFIGNFACGSNLTLYTLLLSPSKKDRLLSFILAKERIYLDILLKEELNELFQKLPGYSLFS